MYDVSNMIFTTIFDLLLIGAIVWGFIHEDKIIDFEDRLARRFAYFVRRKYRNWKATK